MMMKNGVIPIINTWSTLGFEERKHLPKGNQKLDEESFYHNRVRFFVDGAVISEFN